MAILSDTHVLSIHYTYTSKYTEYTYIGTKKSKNVEKVQVKRSKIY